MKKLIFSAVLALAALSASAQTLVVYYSRTGQNYTSDGIIDLKVGNTAVVAKQIQKLTGADIFQLETVRQYAADYYECTREAKEELNAQARPALKADIDLLVGHLPHVRCHLPGGPRLEGQDRDSVHHPRGQRLRQRPS